jgi:hypothetical protein
MTSEREPPPYWNDERPLGRVYFGRNDWLVHARSHIADERYSHGGTSEVKLFGLAPTGTRAYVQTRFFIHAPEDSFREVPIGQAQAHHYPADGLLTIWELFTEERYRPHDDPREDLLLRRLWRHYERFLVARFPDASRIGALWETDYDAESWAGFLTTLGYARLEPAVFVKPLPSPDQSGSDI